MNAQRDASAIAPVLDLDRYTDPLAMRGRLQQALPGFADGALRIDALRIGQARRNTSKRRNPSPLTLSYELEVTDVAHGRRGTQTLCAQVFRDGVSEAVHRAQDRSRLVAPAFGEPLAHLPELGMVVWSLPNDPALPQLATLLDPVGLAEVLPWPALGAPREAFGAIGVELLRYEPQQRATLRCTLEAPDGGAPRVVYGKTFAGDEAQAVYQRFQHVWRLDARVAPRVARPLGCCERTRTFWQAAATGIPLLEALRTLPPRRAAARIRGVAHAIAELHAAPPALAGTAEPRPVAHWVREARRRQAKLGRVDAALQARVARLADAIEANAPCTVAPLTLIHGDFHPEQVWVDGTRIVLFDFDEFTLGDPMEDLATFVLKMAQARMPGEILSAFVDTYAALAPGRFDLARLDWHLALQGFVQACRAFVFQRPGWIEEIERRLYTSEVLAEAFEEDAR